MLERLLQINREAFATQQYEVAYHALMAALHLVDRSGDRHGLQRIASAAAEEGAAMQSGSALHRLFDTLRVHLDAVRLRMDSATHARSR